MRRTSGADCWKGCRCKISWIGWHSGSIARLAKRSFALHEASNAAVRSNSSLNPFETEGSEAAHNSSTSNCCVRKDVSLTFGLSHMWLMPRRLRVEAGLLFASSCFNVSGSFLFHPCFPARGESISAWIGLYLHAR